MKNFVFLSHLLDSETQGYGGAKNFVVEQASSICCGKSSNSMNYRLNNHIGTHIDGPKHFFNDGKTLDEYKVDFWIFNSVFLYKKDSIKPDEVISFGYLCENIPLDCVLLLIKTGFEKYRQSDIYWNNNPAISPELAFWLKQNRSFIRVIGLDTISLTGYQHRELGKQSHKAFLGKEKGKPILIVEDMHLSHINSNPGKVIILPLLVRATDGSPCTILAEMNS